MPRSKRMELYEPPARQRSGPSPIPAGPTHCVCGVLLEPLRRTGGLCKKCVAAGSKSSAVARVSGVQKHCSVCRRPFTTPNRRQLHCGREPCQLERARAYKEKHQKHLARANAGTTGEA